MSKALSGFFSMAMFEKAATEFLDEAPRTNQPFFLSCHFMEVHSPTCPSLTSSSSPSKSKYADANRRARCRVGAIMDKVREAGLEEEYVDRLDDADQRWPGRVYPDAGTPVRARRGDGA